MTDKQVHRIPADLAQKVSIENHYLHRKCPCTVAYGYYEGDSLLGVILYGCPSSSTLKRGVCGDDEALHVIELKRLWIDDKAERFAESFFISQSLRLMKQDAPDKDIIISYADGGYGHTGIVYQATNWLYTGTSTPFKDIILKGDTRDHLTQQDELKARYGSVKNAIAVLGEDSFERVERSVKHRYIFFNCDKRRRRELMRKLKYTIQDYPRNPEHPVHIANKVKRSGQTSLEGWA